MQLTSKYALRAIERGVTQRQRHLLRKLQTVRPFSELAYEKNEKGQLQFDTLHQLQTYACQEYADKDVFGTHNAETNDFEYFTYAEYGERVNRARSVLQKAGIGAFDKVAIISNNRWEWAVLSAATYSLNATFVPMYQAQLPKDWVYILNDSGASAVFCATQDIYDTVQKEVLSSTPTVQATFCFDTPEGPDYSFTTAMKNAEPTSVIPPTTDDLANLIYTSGTTGNPKGVELTHSNLSSNVHANCNVAEDPNELVSGNDTSLALLPWAHIYAQTCELWGGVSAGSKMAICRGPLSLLEDLSLVKPTILFSVPAVYKQVHAGVNTLIENESPLKASLMRSAIAIGREKFEASQGRRPPLGLVENMKFNALDKVVLSKIRGRFGGNLRWGAAAGAATPTEVINFMESCGIPIVEGYGLTETSPVITLSSPSYRSAGYVGRAVPGVEVYIIGDEGQVLGPGEEGEVCCVGPNVMKGYYNKPEATEEVISVAPDGKSRMFHTGDLGSLREDGFLKITGRLKEQYKLENGKYVVPTLVENEISLSRFVAQVVLYGANMPYNVALIVPALDVIRAELELGEDVSDEEMATDERVTKLIDTELTATLYHVKKYEQPRKWAFVTPFSVENQMLTPKLSIRRHNVFKANEGVISKLYSEEDSAAEQAA